MNWFRLYHDVLDDPKAQQLPLPLFKSWINLLCLASQNDPRGTLPERSDIAFRLRMNDVKTQATIDALLAAGLVDEIDGTLVPHNWDGRQFPSDNATARVKKHRAGGRPSSIETVTETVAETVAETPVETPSETLHETFHVTELKRRRNALDTDTDTDTDTEKKRTTAKRADAPSTNDSYALFLALAEETGTDPAMASKAYATQQCGIAKGLLADGHTESDVRGCLRYLRSQTWRSSPVDLKTVRAEIGKWAMAGKPVAEPTPILTGRGPGGSRRQDSADTLDAFLRIANGEES